MNKHCSEESQVANAAVLTAVSILALLGTLVISLAFGIQPGDSPLPAMKSESQVTQPTQVQSETVASAFEAQPPTHVDLVQSMQALR
jgi:hypothetical protein